MMPAGRLSPLEATQLLVFAVQLMAGAASPCGPDSLLFPAAGLCFWQLNTSYDASAAQQACSSQGGSSGLAVIPLPEVETFLVQNFDFEHYDCGDDRCGTLLVGYSVHQSAIVSMTEPHLPLAWLPDLHNSPLVGGHCFRVRPITLTSLTWQSGQCHVTRRPLCSAWMDPDGSQAWAWRGEGGRLDTPPLATSSRRSLPRCAASCHLRQGCASFNFQRSSGTCQLLSKVKAHPDVTLTPDPGFKHYERRFPNDLLYSPSYILALK